MIHARLRIQEFNRYKPCCNSFTGLSLKRELSWHWTNRNPPPQRRRWLGTELRICCMKPSDVYWHIYRRDGIKPELQGRLVYVLEIPRTPGCPVLRHVFDPFGRDFPADWHPRILSLVTNQRHGLIYDGVSKAAAYDVMLTDPRILKGDSQFLLYNHQIICNSRNFFLNEPERGFESMPKRTAQLLFGRAVKPSNVRSEPAALVSSYVI